MGRLSGKTALITGGSRGIGKAICLAFAKEGCNVAFTYNSSADAANAVAADLEKLGVKAKAYQSNAASFEASQQLITDVTADFEGFTIVVNNAGITRDNLMLRMSEEQWDEVITTNLKSVFNVTKAALRPLLKAREGSIINMSSIIGVGGQAGQANYAASKAGIIGFSKSIAKEVGSRSIRCNAIAPGFVETDMTHDLPNKEEFVAMIPVKRLGIADDIANAALFLASDDSTYITGQVLSVCGGLNI